MDISNNIKKLRKLNNLTQEKLAKKLNLSSQNVSKWEHGISEPSISYCVKMAEIFNISLDSLLSRGLNNYNDLEFRKERMFNDKINANLKNTFPSISLSLICEFKKDHKVKELDDLLMLKNDYSFTKTESKQFTTENYMGRSFFELISINENLLSNNRNIKSKEDSINKTFKEIKTYVPNLLKEKINYLYSKKAELLEYKKKFEGKMILHFWQTYSTPFFTKITLTIDELKKLNELNTTITIGVGNDYYELKKFMDSIKME